MSYRARILKAANRCRGDVCSCWNEVPEWLNAQVNAVCNLNSIQSSSTSQRAFLHGANKSRRPRPRRGRQTSPVRCAHGCSTLPSAGPQRHGASPDPTHATFFDSNHFKYAQWRSCHAGFLWFNIDTLQASWRIFVEKKFKLAIRSDCAGDRGKKRERGGVWGDKTFNKLFVKCLMTFRAAFVFSGRIGQMKVRRENKREREAPNVPNGRTWRA